MQPEPVLPFEEQSAALCMSEPVFVQAGNKSAVSLQLDLAVELPVQAFVSVRADSIQAPVQFEDSCIPEPADMNIRCLAELPVYLLSDQEY